MKDILVHPSLKEGVLDKTKKVTVRNGTREFIPGEIVRIGCDSYGWFEAKVRSVSFTYLIDIDEYVIRDDGFKDWGELFNTMRKFYPNIDVTSNVTVIRWEYV